LRALLIALVFLPEGFELGDASISKRPDMPEKRIDRKLYLDLDSLVALQMNAKVISEDPYNKEWSRMD
jgi:hypothetical protein